MGICPFETVAKERFGPFWSLCSKEDFEIYEYAGDLGGSARRVRTTLYRCHVTDRSSGLEVLQVLFKASSDRSTNSLTVSRTPPHTTARKPTALYLPPLLPSRWIRRCIPISRTTPVWVPSPPWACSTIPRDPSITRRPSKIEHGSPPRWSHMTVQRVSYSVHSPSLATTTSRLMGWSWTTGDAAEDDHEGKEDGVRISVDGTVQPSEFCGARKDCICGLKGFIRGQEYARKDGLGDFEGCKYTGGEFGLGY